MSGGRDLSSCIGCIVLLAILGGVVCAVGIYAVGCWRGVW